MITGPPALADYRDTFDRPDSADLGPAWRPEFGNLVVATNRAQSRPLPSNTARTGSWETYVGDYGGRLLTDNWELEVPIQPPVGTGSVANFTSFGVGMLEDGPGPGMVLVYATTSRTTGPAGGTRIMTWESSSIPAPGTATNLTGQTTRATTGTASTTTATITFRRRMYSATQSIFTLLINGAPSLTWDDTTGVVPAGDALRRRWFIGAEANFPNFLQNQYSSALSQVRARDLTV